MIGIAPVTFSSPTPTGVAAAFYTWAAPRVLNWLGGDRNTEALIPGESFPGYDSAGNPIEWEDVYRYADYFWPQPEEEPLMNHSAMDALRLYIVTPDGVQTGRWDYEDTVGMWFPTVEDLYRYSRANNELVQELSEAEYAALGSGALAEPVGTIPPDPDLAGNGLPWWVWTAGLWVGKKVFLG